MKKTFWEQIQEKQEKYIQENLNEIAEEIKRNIFDDIEKEREKMEMSKYKNGDKFIIEIEVNETFGNFYRIKGSDCNLPERCLDGLKKFDETKMYEQGLGDAWEAAKKIILSCKDYSTLKPTDFQAVFGTVDMSEVFENFTADEVIAKIKKHEKKQVINVGDEIRYSDNRKGVVLQVFQYWNEDKNRNENSYKVLCSNGCGQLIYDTPVYNIKKTGRHFPQVEEMLKAMKE